MYSDYQMEDDSVEGFTFLEAPPEAPGELSRIVNVTTYFYDSLSSNSEIDPRACVECMDKLTLMMEDHLKFTEEEYNDYIQFLQTLEAEHFDEDIRELEKELEDLLLEEEKVKFELSMERLEEKEITFEYDALLKRNKELVGEELKYFRSYYKYLYNHHSTQEELISLNSQIVYNEGNIEVLKNTNIFQTTFNIWYKDGYGTINELRLGYLSSAPVDWNEINAAWGQISLLLLALAKRMNLKFKKFRLVPFGNHSYIEMTVKKKKLPLFGYGSFKFRFDNKLDRAMVAFLECLQQLKESNQSVICFPYKIKSATLEDDSTGISYSIRIQFNSEEHWTKSLKFLVTNLKWALMSLPILDREGER